MVKNLCLLLTLSQVPLHFHLLTKTIKGEGIGTSDMSLLFWGWKGDVRYIRYIVLPQPAPWHVYANLIARAMENQDAHDMFLHELLTKASFILSGVSFEEFPVNFRCVRSIKTPYTSDITFLLIRSLSQDAENELQLMKFCMESITCSGLRCGDRLTFFHWLPFHWIVTNSNLTWSCVEDSIEYIDSDCTWSY